MTTRVSRRSFLAGGAAASLLVACGGSSSAAPTSGPVLVNLFSTDRVLAAGRPQRVPFGVVSDGTIQLADDAELGVTVRVAGGDVIDNLTVRARIVDHDHGAAEVDPDHQHADLLRYFPLRVAFPQPGIYDLEVDFGGGRISSLPVQAFDPAEVVVPQPGDRMPRIDTPTTARPDGIDPLCTLAPDPCPLHQLSVAEVLDSGRPLALLVATPALCQTAYCGPVLNTLLTAAPRYPDVVAVHLEVYANAADVRGNYTDPNLTVAQPVLDLGLAFEPSLFLVDGSGRIVDRIDNLFDATELDAALTALA